MQGTGRRAPYRVMPSSCNRHRCVGRRPIGLGVANLSECGTVRLGRGNLGGNGEPLPAASLTHLVAHLAERCATAAAGKPPHEVLWPLSLRRSAALVMTRRFSTRSFDAFLVGSCFSGCFHPHQYYVYRKKDGHMVRAGMRSKMFRKTVLGVAQSTSPATGNFGSASAHGRSWLQTCTFSGEFRLCQGCFWDRL